MEAKSLTGRTLKAVWLFPSDPVHSAWVNELTTPIVAYDAFLELADDVLLQLSACEVALDEEKYPSLGLELRESSPTALRVIQANGHVTEAQRTHRNCRKVDRPTVSHHAVGNLRDRAFRRYRHK